MNPTAICRATHCKNFVHAFVSNRKLRLHASGANLYKNKAELKPGLTRDRAATWRLTVNLD